MKGNGNKMDIRKAHIEHLRKIGISSESSPFGFYQGYDFSERQNQVRQNQKDEEKKRQEQIQKVVGEGIEKAMKDIFSSWRK